MSISGPVLVAIDLSDAAEAALRQGQAIAASLGVAWRVCHVLPEAYKVRVLFPQDAGIDRGEQAELERTAGAAVRARIVQILGAPGSSVEVDLESGTPHAGVLAVAHRLGAGLVVVGPGPTALRIARSYEAPVLVARPSPTGGTVVGATDFSDPSLPALRLAADEARRRNARLRVVHCLDVDETIPLATATMAGMVPIPPLPRDVIARIETGAQARLRDALGQTGADGDAVVVRGPAVLGIVEAATTPPAALVVVGSRGRTGLARLALGSVAESVVNDAPCSVMVVPLHPAR